MSTTPSTACETCPSNRNSELQRLGLNVAKWDYVVALAGNPNTGKSTVFNTLTGLRQHTGNWPGKTIARAEGGFSYREKKFKIVDLPGTYSLLSATPDEEVARDFILFGKPSVTVVVADATCLERNLNLALQILQISERVILCLNLIDEARAHQISIDVRNLSRDLGIPVVPCAARQGEGIGDLLGTIYDVVTGSIATSPYRMKFEIPGIREPLEELTGYIRSTFPHVANPQWIALRLLDGDRSIIEAIQRGELGLIPSDHSASVIEGETL